MDVEIIPSLIQQFRETFEGDVGSSWITDGKPDSGMFGVIKPIAPKDAFMAIAAGHRSLAEHVQHVRFSMDLFYKRMQGQDPSADWGTSFDIEERSAEKWVELQAELKRLYDAVMSVVNEQSKQPLEKWPAIYIVGLAAMTAHTAYHLGSIRQIAIAVTSR
jgi:hypothetical protein